MEPQSLSAILEHLNDTVQAIYQHPENSRPRKRKTSLNFEESARRILLNRYRANARYRGYVWNLTEEEFFSAVSLPCSYCGIMPSAKVSYRDCDVFYNGIDRIDNSKGYEPDNILPCCKICNQAKHTLPFSDFEAWLDRIVSFRSQ